MSIFRFGIQNFNFKSIGMITAKVDNHIQIIHKHLFGFKRLMAESVKNHFLIVWVKIYETLTGKSSHKR